MSHHASRDYARLVKRGVGSGISLFLIGELGQLLAPRIQSTVPDWELTLFVWASVGGILLVLGSIFGFGLALPLLDS